MDQNIQLAENCHPLIEAITLNWNLHLASLTKEQEQGLKALFLLKKQTKGVELFHLAYSAGLSEAEEKDLAGWLYCQIPIYSVCKIHSTRYFWVAWSSWAAKHEHCNPLGTGFAKNKYGAENAAQEALGPYFECLDSEYAAVYYDFQAFVWKSPADRFRPYEPDRSAGQEYVYSLHLPVTGHGLGRVKFPYLIVKKTQNKVFVDLYGNPSDGLRSGDIIALDRKQLESMGYIYCSRTRFTFYSEEGRKQLEGLDFTHTKLPCSCASQRYQVKEEMATLK